MSTLMNFGWTFVVIVAQFFTILVRVRAMLPKLTNHMFLDANISQYVEHVRQAHAESFEFIERLNELAHRSLFSAKVASGDVQAVLVSTLLQRALTAFQATIILGERGLPEESKVALRTLLEVMFKIVAIAKDEEVAKTFILEDVRHRRKFLNKFKLLNPTLENVDKQVLESLLESTTKQIQDKDIRELKTQWFAAKAGLTDFYNSAYAILSDSVHANVRTLERALNVDENGNLVGLNYSFSDEDLDDHLLAAAETLIFALRATFSKVEVGTAEEIHTMHDEFDALYTKITNRK